jgi:hypothetical protein
LVLVALWLGQALARAYYVDLSDAERVAAFQQTAAASELRGLLLVQAVPVVVSFALAALAAGALLGRFAQRLPARDAAQVTLLGAFVVCALAGLLGALHLLIVVGVWGVFALPGVPCALLGFWLGRRRVGIPS